MLWMASGSPMIDPTRRRGVERTVGILEDHLHAAAVGTHLRPGQGAQIGSVEDEPPGGQREEPHDASRQGRLSAPGLADEPERFPAAHLEADPVDGLDAPDLVLEEDAFLDGEVLDDLVGADAFY